MKNVLFQAVGFGFLIVGLVFGMGSEAYGQQSKAPINAKSCLDAKNFLVRSLRGKSLTVVISKAAVDRSGNPTSRKQSLSFIVGPAESSVGNVDQATGAWEAAQNALVSVTLPMVKPVLERCSDVAEVKIGLQQSDFIREFAVTKEAGNGKPLVVLERSCVDSEKEAAWDEQYCL